MRKEGFGKRLLSVLLALVMIVGILPASVWAADAVLDAVIFASDVHGSTSDLKSAFGGINLDVNASAVGFVGDTCLTTSTVSSTVTSALGYTPEITYSYAASHDTENSSDIGTNWNYSGEAFENDNYVIYTIRETDMESTSAASTAAAAFTTWASTADTTKPVFIISHRPLHERRDDNAGAATWYSAISAAAEKMDIVFFWAHNHTGEDTVDTDAYYVEKDGSETIAVEGGSTVVPNFTYMNAGYINANGQNPARKGIATTVQLYADKMVFQDYNSSGAYTGSYAHNVTVDFEFAKLGETVIPTTLNVTGTSEYAVGDTFVAPTVTVTYSDGTTGEALASDAYTVTGEYDMNTAGTYILTYTYTEGSYSAEAQFTFEVVAKEVSYITISKGTTAYTVGDDLTFTVFVYYKDGTSAYVTQDACEIVPNCCDTDSVEKLMNTVANGTDNGYHQVTITYGGKSTTYSFTVGEAVELADTENNTGVKVHVFDGVFSGISAAESTNAYVTNLTVEKNLNNYKAYDITPVGGLNEGNYAKVSLPVDASWDTSKLAAYYVSDDGKTIEKMEGEYADGYYTFRVSHFSTYVVGESTEIEVPDPTTQTVTGATTTEKKTVYVLTSSISSGNEYLIVNGNSAGSYYALANNSGSVAATGVTVKADSSIGTYIELEDVTDELWTTSGSSSTSLKNGSYYLSYSGRRDNYSLELSNSATFWSYSSNRLSLVPNRTTYYLRYNSGWSFSSTSSNVYFYVPTEITVTTSANGTYSIAGTPAEVSKVVVEGTTTTLGSTLTFKPESGDATTTDTSTTATYTVVENGDPNGIISGISGNTVTFSGNYGKALVKVSYTVTVNSTDYTVDNYIVVTATAPYYEIAIQDEDGTTVSGTTVSLKGITNGQTVDLNAVVNMITNEGSSSVTDAAVEWNIPEEYLNIATIGDDGVVTLKGVDGAFYVMVTYTKDGKDYTTGVNFSVTTSQYSVPSDGTSDFPEYPNEGAVRFDKVATAVGNFSETGIAQVELSMTGVPYTTNNAMDVVVMLDMTGSMSDNGMEAAELATIAFMEKIVKNEDGSYNDNRIAVYAFNSGSSSPYELVSLKQITNDTELATATTAIKTASDKQASGGTPFDEATQKCYEVLKAAKTDGIGNNRQQFCVFMSDGGPTSYAMDDGDGTYTTVTNSGSGTTAITTYLSGYSSSTSSSWEFTLGEEYYTNQMKAAGVTIYTVGLLLQTAPNNPSPYSSMTDSDYNSTTDSLTSVGSHYYFTSAILKQMATDESKYIDIFNVNNADNATAKFTAIAQSILEAAKNVVVQDKIADDYTMVFDIPTGSYEDNNEAVAEALKDQEFYIEFVQYALDSNHERTTETSLVKLYLGNEDGTYYAASDNSGTKFADPVFTAAEEGKKAYWSTVDSTYTAKAGEIVINVNGTYYKFIADGSGEYNMTSGAYAYGTIDSTTSTSQDLVIITPYFAYSAATRMLAWTVDKLTTVEYALRYFLFLDSSSTDIGEDTEVDAGPYQTNDWATLTYTNFNGNECQQEFPVPQMTWNGAEVSYVFYLVNAAGQPINKSGQVVDFANATFVTDVFTQVVTWNTATGEGAEELNVNYLADKLLPDAYKIYDKNAEYTIHVYQDAAGNSVFDYFIIDGSDSGLTSYTTTKVYNTKAGTKYADYGTYSAEAVGTKFPTTDASGNSVTITTTKQASLDYSDTTVAFAVLWEPALVEDTVVVDFGLDVLINVVQNDNLQNTVSGIGVGNSAYGSVAMNTGVSATSQLGTSALTIDGNTISIENENQIRFHQGDMTFKDPVTFYYESPVEFYEESSKREGYMYSSVTVIPATTIYYEDSFVDLAATGSAVWETVGTEKKATQDQDRPGESQISADLDADNNYGFDSAYTDSFAYSMGSAKKITVSAGNAGRASFTFYGTGFDVIALTSNTTGAIFVKVYSVADDGTKTEVKSLTVDTYYGYTMNSDGEWVLSENTPNSLYQVPVMKVEGLTYGKYYVTITATYQSLFDHNTITTTDETTGETTTAKSGSYDFYLDAVRIYDPTGNQDGTANNAYVADGEGWPQYTELRNNIIAAEGVTTAADGTVTFPTEDTMAGAIFIDSNNANTNIADYVSYGPNNELYLAAGQSVAFKLDQTYASIIADVQIALKVGNGGTVSYKIYDADKTTADAAVAKTLNTATDLYYSIKDLSSGTIVITNSGDSGILSITNIKVTYTQNPYGTSSSSLDDGIMLTGLYMDEVGATSAVMSLRRMNSADINPADPEVEEDQPEINAPEVEENQPEINDPEVEENQPEINDPEVEENQPEINDPEVEEDQPEVNDPKVEEDVPAQTESEGFFEKIGNFFKKLFGWLFS